MARTSIDCPGCDWIGYSHTHIDAEDGPRADCCVHVAGCRRSAPPVARCGRSVLHGAHGVDGPGFCAGNRDVLVAL